MQDYHEVNLLNLNNGAAQDLFLYELGKVIDNITDESTPAKTRREITIKVSLFPSGDRDTIATSVCASSKLAPVKPHEHYMVLGNRGDGIKAYTADPRQQHLGFEEPNADNISHISQGGSR